MIIIVDFDGTLAIGHLTPLLELDPNKDLIERLWDLKRTINPTIKIVTARGSRYHLTEEQKNERYLKDITTWLQTHNVPYDSISFNKEYGSLYIDDMAINPFEDFSALMRNHTKNKLIFTENTVLKYTTTAKQESEWYKHAKGILPIPEILFANDELLIMERIKDFHTPTGFEMCELIEYYKDRIIPNYQFATYKTNIQFDLDSTDKTRKIVEELPIQEPTFFHGDLSTTNILITNRGQFRCIDPNYKGVFGNYMTDAGKAFFSFIAFERNYDEAKCLSNKFGKDVMRFAVAEGLRVCKYSPQYISIVNNIADLI